MMKIPGVGKSGALNSKLKEKKELTRENFIEFLNGVYDKALTGDPKIRFIGAEHLAVNFLEKYKDNNVEGGYKKLTCEKIIKNQVKTTSSTGFMASVGGLLTMPFTIPTDMYLTILVEMRMILAIAYIGGYDLRMEQLRTYVFVILSGKESKDIFIKVGLKPIGKNLTYRMVQKIPQKLLEGINRKIGFIMFSKFSSKGALQLGMAVPLVGGLIGGSINYYFTKRRGKYAIKAFIEDDTYKELKEQEFEV